MAIADGVAASWETKATFFTWRPFFAVHEADLDGNPDTEADPPDAAQHLDRRFSGVAVGPVHVLGRRLAVSKRSISPTGVVPLSTDPGPARR